MAFRRRFFSGDFGQFAAVSAGIALLGLAGCANHASAPSGNSGISAANQVTVANCAGDRQVGRITVSCPGQTEAKLSTSQLVTADSVRGQAFLARVSGQPGKFFKSEDSTGAPNDTAPSATPDSPPPAPAAAPGSLLATLPIELLGEQYVFGGVITKVSDTANPALGGMKLTDLPPLQVRPMLAKDEDGKNVVALVGCLKDCDELAKQDALIGLPITAVDDQAGTVTVDLAAIAKDLDLMAIVDSDSSETGLKSRATRTVSFDYSLSTLVFDIETDMVPKDAPKNANGPKDPATPVTTFTSRWYLRLTSAFDPAFEARPATPGVGFFLTEGVKNPKIERQPLSQADGPEIHYYIKNVPAEYQASFAASIDAWNGKFQALVGRKLLSYEFVAADDPQAALLVPGDVRYHIIEWDLVNAATYGGLGPSIANPFTGEILTSNILIQGPTIVKLYTAWFKVKQDADTLRAAGRAGEADMKLLAFKREVATARAQAAGPAYHFSLNSKLDLRITSQMPGYRDPLGNFDDLDPFEQRDDFENTPAGVDYPTYMAGYFRDMVEHEMGHNMGLRHNFRGNLGAAPGAPQAGKVSASVMEYLGRPYRYLDGIGPYDEMAIAYGYTGKAPAVLNAYCTDEDQGTADKPKQSAECSQNDATDDPFSFFEGQLTKAIDKLTARTTPAGDAVWTTDDMANELGIAFTGLGLYASSAATTGAAWTNFFGKPGRPASSAQVPDYVVARIKAQLCDPALAAVVATRPKAMANLESLELVATVSLKPFGIAAGSVACP